MHKAISDSCCKLKGRFRVLAPIVLLSSLFLSTAGQAADSVGSVKFTRGDVTIESSSGDARKAAKGDDLMQNELVVTGANGIAVILLNDDSRMTLRPYTRFRVNRLDMDGDSGSRNAVLNLLRGGLRLVTGLIGKANPAGYRLSTPVATVGIRGTEFNTRLCGSDCAAEEGQLAGSEAAETIDEGLYVNVDDGEIFLQNFSGGDPLDLQQGESGYVADLNSLPVKLSLVPAFQLLDKIPSPSQLDFDNIEMPDDLGQTNESEAEVAAAPAVAAAAAAQAEATGIDISGTYEIEVSYGSALPRADRRWFFGSSPDIEFTLTQEGNKFTGEFEGDRDGTIKGEIDGKEVTFELQLEALGGEYKEGAGTWTIQSNGDLEGDFNIRDQQRGVVRGRWTLEKD